MGENRILLAMIAAASLLSTAAFALNGADVAIYKGTGTWADGITAFKKFLDSENITWEEVTARDVNNNDLRPLYKGIYMPGGYNYYTNYIKSSGTQHIKDLVNSGGAYIGICAGAYYASDKVIWQGGYEDYPLDFFDGNATGPFDNIAVYPKYNMTNVTVNTANPVNHLQPSKYTMLYYGGPGFYQRTGSTQVVNTLLAWDAHNNDKAAVNIEYGSGRVVLIGPHPEIEEDSARDGTGFADELNDVESDWPFLSASVQWALKIQAPAPDTTPPTIHLINDSPDPLSAGQMLKIEANVTDNAGAASVWAEILSQNYTMALNNGSTTELFFDSFESGTLNGWQAYGNGYNNWSIENTDSYSGTYNAGVLYTGSSKYAYLEKGISTAGYNSIVFSFYRKRLGLDSVDEFRAEWNNGSGWQVLEGGHGNDASYVFREFSLPSEAANNPDFRIRFVCEANAASEGCRIDNVRITAKTQGTGLYECLYNTTGMPQQTYDYAVNAKDASNNQATPSQGTFTII